MIVSEMQSSVFFIARVSVLYNSILLYGDIRFYVWEAVKVGDGVRIPVELSWQMETSCSWCSYSLPL